MSDTPQTINGELLRLKRESLGWLVSDMATRACMSVKQIRQLEEGGSSAFYSDSVKLTSAKKVGAILGLTSDDVFGVAKSETAMQAPDASAIAFVQEAHPANAEQVNAARLSEEAGTSTEVDAPAVMTTSVVETVEAHTDAVVASSETKNKTPLAAIAALFVAALAVAAWMRPEAEPIAAEPPPPLQTLPAETSDAAASAASEAEPVASAVVAATPASAASLAASRSAPAGSAPSTAPPAASASPASKPL